MKKSVKKRVVEKVHLFYGGFFSNFVLAVFFILSIPTNLFSLTLSGDWIYQNSKNNNSQTSSRYSADMQKSISLTPAMMLSGSMHLSRNEDENNTTNSYTPSLSYNLTNHIFNLRLNGTANKTENSRSSGMLVSSLFANWNSNWTTGGFVPSVSFFGSSSNTTDDLSEHLSDSDYQNVGSNLAWNFEIFSFSYNNSFTRSTDNIFLTENNSLNHNANLSTEKSFWSNKGSATFSQSYSYNENETSTIRDSSGISLIPTTIIQTYYDEVNPSLNVSLPLEAAGRLANRDKNDAAITVNNPPDPLRMNIAVRVNFQKVDVVYLYTQSLLGSEKSEFTSWKIYSSSDNLNWTLKQTFTAPLYNSTFKRFEFRINQLQTDYLKIVAVDHPLTTAVIFSEIEVYEQIAGNSITKVKRDFISYASNFGLNLELKKDLIFSSSASYQKNSSSNETSSERKNINANIGWNPGQYFSSGLSANLSYQTNASGLDTENRSYGLRLSLPALPTLETSFGFTINEYYENSIKQNSSYNTSVDLEADLYHDLHASMHNSYNISKYNQSGDSNNTLSSTLTLQARLLPKIFADSSLSYAKSKGSNASENFLLNVHWRPSNILSASVTYNQSWSTTSSSRYSLSATYAMTPKIQLGINRSSTLKPVSTSTNSVDIIWDINEVFTLTNTGSFSQGADRSSWSTSSRLTARYDMF